MKIILKIIFILVIFCFTKNFSLANPDTSKLDIYKIDLSLLNSFDTLEKGTQLNLVLLNDLSTNKKHDNSQLNFLVPVNNTGNITASAFITMSASGQRLSMHSTLEISTTKLTLENEQEVNFSASSPLFQGTHPPHAKSTSFGLAKAITSLTLASTPATLGASLGISFLVNGILSAHRNGISDFVWGGLDGSRLSFVENILRKQPDIYFESGTVIPFTLNEELKISKGIKKEKIESVNISKDEAINKIQQLLKWGDLTGAIEFSAKTGQEEIYNELLTKISL